MTELRLGAVLSAFLVAALAVVAAAPSKAAPLDAPSSETAQQPEARGCNRPVLATAPDPFATDLEAALNIFREARTLERQEESLAALLEVTQAYPHEWLGHYWTAHVHGQNGRLYDDRRFPESIRHGLESLKRAWELNSGKSAMDRSELYALQCLLNRLASMAVKRPDAESALGALTSEEYLTRSIESLKLAGESNPSNPRVALQRGVTLVFNRKYQEGIEVLEEASKLHEEFIGLSSNYPDWGAVWLQAWIPRAKQLLAEQAGS